MLGIPQRSQEEIIFVLFLLIVLFFLSFRLKVLDKEGNIFSFILGLVVGLFGGLYWLILLLTFVVLGFIGTKFKYETKKKRGVAEKRRGKRGWYNVLANGLIPAIIAFFSPQLGTTGIIMYTTSLAVATSDTLASEIGVLSDDVYLIINPFKRVKPGLDGGVSLLGQGAAFSGAFLISLISLLLIPFGNPEFERNISNFLFPFFFGFIGCQIDSVLGATLEREGYIGKGGVNFFSIALGSLLAGGLYHLFL